MSWEGIAEGGSWRACVGLLLEMCFLILRRKKILNITPVSQYRMLGICHITILDSYVLFCTAAAAAAESLQSCPTLCDPIDGSPLGSPVPEILQARTLEWVAISLSNA